MSLGQGVSHADSAKWTGCSHSSRVRLSMTSWHPRSTCSDRTTTVRMPSACARTADNTRTRIEPHTHLPVPVYQISVSVEVYHDSVAPLLKCSMAVRRLSWMRPSWVMQQMKATNTSKLQRTRDAALYQGVKGKWETLGSSGCSYLDFLSSELDHGQAHVPR